MSEYIYKGKISVVLPMYNSQNTVVAALESIRNQTAFDKIAEIIVVNDGSVDNSYEIVKRYKFDYPNMPIILLDKENGGVSSARNAGLKKSKSEYIALLDSDDRWLLNKTEIQLNILEKNPHIDFLGGNYNDKNLRVLTRKIDKLYRANIKDLCIKFFPVTPSAIFKKKVINKIGYFDESRKYAEDGHYFMKICSNFNYYHTPKQLVICGDGKPEFGSSGLSSNLQGMYKGNVRNIKELKEDGLISKSFYVFLRLFYSLKYLRRILLTKLRKKSEFRM